MLELGSLDFSAAGGHRLSYKKSRHQPVYIGRHPGLVDYRADKVDTCQGLSSWGVSPVWSCCR
jgi:hypothetical protein